MKQKLSALYEYLQQKMRGKWNRVLPFGELLVDRWEKARFCGFGKNTSIYDSSVVLGDVEVGDNVWIGPFTMLDGSGAVLSIGDGCSISTGVHIYTHDTVDYCVSGGMAKKETAPVHIGKYCYIGPMAIIGKGVNLGKSCIVSANSFVNKSYPDFSIVAGTPAMQIGHVVVDENGAIVREYTSHLL